MEKTEITRLETIIRLETINENNVLKWNVMHNCTLIKMREHNFRKQSQARNAFLFIHNLGFKSKMVLTSS